MSRTATAILLMVALSSAAFVENYPNCVKLNGDDIRLYWGTNDTHIHFGVGEILLSKPQHFLTSRSASTYTRGWSAFGLSDDGTMNPGTDVYVVSYNAVGDYTIPARHNPPTWDGVQNIGNILYGVNGTHLYAEFNRPLLTVSPDKDIVPAYGSYLDGVHQNHGSLTIDFFSSSVCDVPTSSSATSSTSSVITSSSAVGSTSSSESGKTTNSASHMMLSVSVIICIVSLAL
ncbi:hypothetical protein PROFUN_04216 [Planoprotostelium fungivorum]|uniref:DOMON domain-containing protein n=1 Tax=Planoprotostelium fungivorum TaxID=1890364 RepID=A0A2P6NVY7_9EUKA|nr:hypothetical protein PROFUN_04216 [Planoprotostelium fungivorum]